MPVIEILPDRFKAQEKLQLASIGQGVSTSQNHIRRPTRGIAIKEDSFATMRVVAGSGKSVALIDAGSRRVDPTTNQIFEVDGKRATDIYSNFFLQSINEERSEKQQILETFGEPFIFLFGERARIISFSGILLNTFDFNWEAEWWHNYDHYLRGTRCVENDARVFLNFDETLITGYITAVAATKSAQDKNWVNFQFHMFVTGYTNYSRIGDPNALPGLTPNQNYEERFSAEELAPFRPSIVDTNTTLNNLGPIPTSAGGIGDLSLANGLAATLSSVSATFNSIRNQAESVVKRLSDMANGTIIRVPVGFAGAMEFDDEIDPASLKEVTGAGVVKYSTFDKNDDEYVGGSDHYGSSVRQDGANRVLDVGLSKNSETQNIIEAAWAGDGFVAPAADQALMSSLIVRAGFGVAAVGSNAAWRASLPVESPDAFNSLATIRTPNGPGLIEE